jgi:acyl-CoA synthetase (AMP-forming)/AMP-acid ligase II
VWTLEPKGGQPARRTPGDALRRATVGDMLRRQARRQPDRTAIVHYNGGTRIAVTYAELDELAEQCADDLQDRNVSHGAVVGAALLSRLDMVTTYFACLKIGAPFVAMNPSLTNDEFEYQLHHAAPRLMFPSLIETASVRIPRPLTRTTSR